MESFENYQENTNEVDQGRSKIEQIKKEYEDLPYEELAAKLERSVAYRDKLNNPDKTDIDAEIGALRELENEKKPVK